MKNKYWLLGIVDQLIFSASSFVNGIIVARTASHEEFGLYVLGTTLIILMIDLQSGLISLPQSLNTPQLCNERAAIFTGSTLVQQAALAMLCSVALITVGSAIAKLRPSLAAMVPVINVVSLFALPILLRDYLRRLYYIQGRLWNVIALDACIASAQVIFLLFIGKHVQVQAHTAHLGAGAACLAFAFPALYLMRKKIVFSISSVWPDLAKNFKIGKWAVINNVLWTAGSYFYPWLLASSHGTKATGLWAAATAIVSVMHIALVGILNVLTPDIATVYAEGGIPKLREYVFRACTKYLFIALLLACFPLILGTFAVSAIYGESYKAAANLVPVLVINALFFAVTGPVSRGLTVIGGARVDFNMNVAVVIFVFTAGTWAVSEYGPVGAAFSLAAANAISMLLRCVGFNYLSGPRYKNAGDCKSI